MGEKLSLEDGRFLIRQARECLKCRLGGKKFAPASTKAIYSKPRGVFVSLHTYPALELRGCIGFPEPKFALLDAVCMAAVHAGLDDHRFENIKESELDSVVFELSVLTIPELMKDAPLAREKGIKIGQDGLIIEYGQASGLLLPQVPIEWNWSQKEFLEALCNKAGLPRDMHKSASAKIYKFQAQVFEEQSPSGKVAEKRLIR